MSSIDPLPLLRAAEQALVNAYAPYSQFRVGAAILADDHTIVTGCNVENASYGLTTCAERSAVFAGIRDGHASFQAVAVVCEGDAPAYPCGACRQVLSEFCGPDTPVFVAATGAFDRMETLRLGDLLPNAFEL